MAKVKIKVPAVITADGKWAVHGCSSTVEEPDWCLVDEMCDYENPTICPQRYMIEVELDVPEMKTVVAVATPA